MLFCYNVWFYNLENWDPSRLTGLSKVTKKISKTGDKTSGLLSSSIFWMCSTAFLFSRIWDSANTVDGESEWVVPWKYLSVEVETQFWNFAGRKSHPYNDVREKRWLGMLITWNRTWTVSLHLQSQTKY